MIMPTTRAVVASALGIDDNMMTANESTSNNASDRSSTERLKRWILELLDLSKLVDYLPR